VCSHRRRFGLLVPATNTTMESELWTILVRNRDRGLDGVGIHTSPVRTPRPDVGSPEAFERFKRDFLGGLADATAMAMLAKPQYLIVGMSLEHLVAGIEPVRATMDRLAEGCDLSWATWHDAAKAALDRFRARRIALITPFDRDGNESAARMFRDLGFEVVANFGFCCANVQHIAHIPDEAKERAVTELLATAGNRLDAVVQCGTNMSMVAVAERLEPRLGIPVLSINATLLWYALRESGIDARAHGAGRLLREF
jgi:maleate isomerase